MDNISVDLIHLILDVLEYFEFFKLCMIICNRYYLKDRIGRFIVSLGFKYSNIMSLKSLQIRSLIIRRG